MIVQAKVQLHIPCPSCLDGKWRADQLAIGQSTVWSCQECHNEASIKRINENDFETTSRGRKDTPVTVTLQSITEPRITLKLNTWKYAHSQNDSLEDYESHQRYFYDEHTCPTNWTRDIVEIIFQSDHDPHGVFEFVSIEDGHMIDNPYGDGMVLESSIPKTDDWKCDNCGTQLCYYENCHTCGVTCYSCQSTSTK